MAVFRQATSREDDPQIHSHVVVSAKVRAPDGQWMALDARYLKRHQRALGGLYQSVLRAELSHRYAVAWGPIENGQAEIAGMPAELLAAFSKRTTQVNTALGDKIAEFRDRQGRDPSRWERAALPRPAHRSTTSPRHGARRQLGSAGPRIASSPRCEPQHSPRRSANPSQRPTSLSSSQPAARRGPAPTCSEPSATSHQPCRTWWDSTGHR
jgi:hypothetical protein